MNAKGYAVVMLSFFVSGCETISEIPVTFEDDHYLQMPDGRVKVLSSDPLLVGSANGVSYLKSEASDLALSCACDGQGGRCYHGSGGGFVWCLSGCKGRCWGTIKRPPTNINWETYDPSQLPPDPCPD